MSWTQVYITGLSRSVEPSDEDIETMLDEKYGLSTNDDVNVIMWAGPGTTLIKRDANNGYCRGFAFLSFYSLDGATAVVDRINNASSTAEHNNDDKNYLFSQQHYLRAELSIPKSSKKNNSKGNNDSHKQQPDLRLRRQRRKQPIRKHPVIVSSDKKKTNLGNKTR